MVERHPGPENRDFDVRLIVAATALEEASKRLVVFAERVRVAGPAFCKPEIRAECDHIRAAIGQVSDHMLRLYMDVIASEL